MTGRLDPMAASRHVIETYRRYTSSLLKLRSADLSEAFDEALVKGALTKGPMLEATPPYQPGSTLAQLIGEGVLDEGFAALDSPALPLHRPLHLHQESAVRKACAGRSLVVSTGTGSGKTESFLIPILNELVAQQRKGTLGPGVRALLLYPMNALANDQVKRLRELLGSYPSITFGRYTGETKQSPREGLAQFGALNAGRDRLPNELLSRQEMQASPPHILLTNYAMLEYLLLRPQDLTLFEGDTWRFIALDEAHVYDGAKGAEIALLLRRLRQRVAPGRPIQCIATSASLEGSHDQVMTFAEGVFGTTFEWVEGDARRQDLVTAVRLTKSHPDLWGPLTGTEWRQLGAATDFEQAVKDLAAQHGVKGNSAAQILDRERSLVHLRQILSTGPRSAEQVATELFDTGPGADDALTALVTVASSLHTEDRNPLLSARYHLFARASEGAFTCLSPTGPHIQLGRHDECPTCNARAFELGACDRCGAAYLSGSLSKGKKRFFLPAGGDEARTWLLLDARDEQGALDDDEAVFDDKAPDVDDDLADLCVQCGFVQSAGLGACRDCNGSTRTVRRLTQVSRVLSACLVCGSRRKDVVRRLVSGGDVTPAVLITELYRHLPTGQGEQIELPGAGRKLLMFSDSRQQAAYAAPYLENSYGRILQRRLLAQSLESVGVEECSYGDLIELTLVHAGQAGVFPFSTTLMDRRRTVSTWLSGELVALDQRQSLEGLGLMKVSHLRPRVNLPQPLLNLGFSEDEAWDLLEELMRSIRQQGVLSVGTGVQPDDEIFGMRKGPIYVREDASEARRKVLSWLPTRGTNRRRALIAKILDRLGSPVEQADPLLRGVWKFAKTLGWFTEVSHGTLGPVRQDNHESLRFTAGSAAAVFECDRCRQISFRSIRGICPTLACDGTLVSLEFPPMLQETNHYRRLYRDFDPIPLAAKEHTAQWRPETAAKIQELFIDGEINVLSSSTTFELGVDVGDLQSVVLRNMPPKTANYVQRAGRAGRRAASAALVLTYAQRRSHDLSRYKEPEKMIAGEMRVPLVPLENERIGRRHAHSVALAAYFRHCFEAGGRMWGTAGDFFLSGAGGADAPVLGVKKFLDPVPSEVSDALAQALPPGVQREIEISTGRWVERLVELLEQVTADIGNEVAQFEILEQEAVAAKKYQAAQLYSKTIKTIEGRNLLGFLGARNVLPKYGFPVDTVELRTSHAGSAVGAQVELARDLTQAIYDYAPGNEVIAGGLRWRSAGVHRLPGKELERRTFRVCPPCGFFMEGAAAAEPCTACGSIEGAVQTYVVPEFGFLCDKKTEDIGMEPPARLWNGATHVRSLGDIVATATWPRRAPFTVEAEAGARSTMVAISSGRRAGFLICDWCGWSKPADGPRPKSHRRPFDDKECTGPTPAMHLGHRFETDLARLTFPGLSLNNDAAWHSMLFAIVEGAAERLDISRDDLDGALWWSGTQRSIVLFDTVPGGAGGARLVVDNLDQVVIGALERVSSCECGEETSCYACLRNYRNSLLHEHLSRAGALAGLHQVIAR